MYLIPKACVYRLNNRGLQYIFSLIIVIFHKHNTWKAMRPAIGCDIFYTFCNQI